MRFCSRKPYLDLSFSGQALMYGNGNNNYPVVSISKASNGASCMVLVIILYEVFRKTGGSPKEII